MSAKVSPIQSETLDFLRGFAAVYVVINHTRGAFFAGGKAWMEEAGEMGLSLGQKLSLLALQSTSLGTEFVILFFCLSGIAMAHSLRRSPRPQQFYLRRAIRIWPPYLAALLLAVVLCLAFRMISPSNDIALKCAPQLCEASSFVQMVFYINPHTNLTPQFWSLPYEVIFYLLCPLLLRSLTTIQWSFFLSIVLTLVGWAFWGLSLNPASSVIVNFFINSFFWFMTGVMGYHFYDRLPRVSWKRLTVILSVLLVFALGVKLKWGGSNAVSSLLMVGVTLLLVRNFPGQLGQVKWLNWGHFSYSIYIFHYAILQGLSFLLLEVWGVQAHEIGSPFMWLLFVAPILFLCWMLSLITERPCIRYLERLRAERTSGA